MLGDDLLCQARPGVKVEIFDRFYECIRHRAEVQSMQELGQLFLGIVHLDNGII